MIITGGVIYLRLWSLEQWYSSGGGTTDERYKDTRCVDADLLVGQIGSQSMGQMDTSHGLTAGFKNDVELFWARSLVRQDGRYGYRRYEMYF